MSKGFDWQMALLLNSLCEQGETHTNKHVAIQRDMDLSRDIFIKTQS